MKKFASFLIPLAVLLIFAVPSFAQEPWRLDFFGAGTWPLDKNFEISHPQSDVPMEGVHEFSLGGRGGIRLGVDGKDYWGMDLIYSYGSNATKIRNKTNGADFAFSMRNHQVSYNVLWYPGGLSKNKTAFPYLTLGVGATFYTLSQKTVNEALDPNRGGLGKLRNEYIFAFNTGGGVRFKLNEKHGIRIDFRDYMSRAVRYQLPKSSDDPNATVFPVGGVFHQLEFSFAYTYYF
jgi:hypothetical protein